MFYVLCLHYCTRSGTGGSYRNGTCLSRRECGERSGGSAQGTCAAGFGVCCVFVVRGGGGSGGGGGGGAVGRTVRQNCTYVQNPDFPAASNSSGPLKYTVKKCTSGQENCLFFQSNFQSGTSGDKNRR